MLLRHATSEGTAVSFIVVATVVTALLILGWRGILGRRKTARQWRARVR